MRTYERTHPWLTFHVDLRHLSHLTWLLLGEVKSKCDHIAGTALRPEVAAELHKVFLSKGIHGTTAIEGNTLSEAEVLARVEGELPLPPSQEYLGLEIDNVVGAYNSIVTEVEKNAPLTLTVDRIKAFNKAILAGGEHADHVVPGEIRTDSVVVRNYVGAPAEDCEYLLDRLCTWLEEPIGDGGTFGPNDDEMNFALAAMKATLAHLYLAWIHPFGDGNGRTARLIEFQLLVQAGAPIPAAHLLSDFYNRTRDKYYLVLSRMSKPPYPVDQFIHYAAQGLVDGLREQIAYIRDQQLDVTWENYVHSRFRGMETPACRRQRHVVLALPPESVVPLAAIPTLTAEVALEYAGKGPKTVTRDINAIASMGLVIRLRRGVLANREAIKAFLPVATRP